MNRPREIDPIKGEIYLAGEHVPAGRYRQIGLAREVVLESEDVLPASLDGRVACYERIEPRGWSQHRNANKRTDNGHHSHPSV